MAKCNGCGAEIVWIETKNKKVMPCNKEITIVTTEKGEIVKGHIPHWIICPKADKFRNKEKV